MVAPVIASKSSTVNSLNGTSNVLSAPSGIADGDLLLIVIGLDGNPTAFTPPSGFTEITPNNGNKAPSNAATLYACFKIASSESGSYTTSWTTGEHNVGFMYRITGAVSGQEIQDPTNTNTGSVTPAIGSDFNTDTADSLALAFSSCDLAQLGSGENGTGWSSEDHANTTGGGPSVGCGVSIKTIGTAGATLDSSRTLLSSEEWVTRCIAVRSIGVPVTITHDTDSVLKALDQEVTHDTDSRLVIGVTLTHDTDSLVYALRTLTHTTDSVLGERDPGFTVTHTTDSLLNVVPTVTHTTDSLVVTSVAVTHDTDSALKKIDNELIHTTDSIVYITQTETHDTDSVLRATDTLVTHDTDSVLKALDQLVTHTTDSALREIDNEISHDTDSILKAIQSLTHTTDSHIVLPTIQTRIHTTDSVLKKLDNIVSHTTDSLLTNIRGKRVITDLCVDETSTEELCVIDESEVDLCA